MAIIVEHRETKTNYILVGTGFGAYKTAKSSVFIANHVPRDDSGEFPMVAVCNKQGDIEWFDSEELIVKTVDEIDPEKMLSGK